MPLPTKPANPAGTSSTSTTGTTATRVVLQHEDEGQGGTTDPDNDLEAGWEDALAKEIVGGKKKVIKDNARRSGADADEALELEGDEGEGETEGDDLEERRELDDGATNGDDEGAEASAAGDPLTRADGAVWNKEARRWIKDNKFVAGDAPEGADDAEASADIEGEGEGEGAEAQGAQSATDGPFKLLEGGQEVELPAGVTVAWKGLNGKEYTHDLKGLVEMAQRGVYNHELQQEVTAAREQKGYIGQLEQYAEQAETRDRQYETYVERLLTDEEFFAQELGEFEKTNTPEARYERATAELERERSARRADRESAQVTATLQSTVFPACEALKKKYPTVKPAEILAELGALTAPLKVQGRVPLARLQEVVGLIGSQLEPWAAQLHEARAERDAAAERKKAAADQVAAQREKRKQQETVRLRKVAARAIAPTGGASTRAGGASGSGSGSQKKPRTPQEAADRALDRALASVGA